ncbi:MAG: phage tail tape measure protein, partial [Clostridia bacterium]
MSNVAAGKDTDDEGESLNDVETTLNSLGITLRKSQYEWKSFEDVLDEVASKWNVFEDTEQSKIATAIAGVRQQENFRALMNNWKEVNDLTDIAANSMGSASEKMEIYLDSVEAKTNEVKATWEEFIINLNQSDSYKGALDLVIFLIDNLPTVATLITSVLITWKSWSFVSNLKREITAATNLLAVATNTERIATELSAIAKANENTEESKSITLKTFKSAQLDSIVAKKREEIASTQAAKTAQELENVADTQSTQKKQIKNAVTIQGTTVTKANTAQTKINTVATETSTIADNKKMQSVSKLKIAMAALGTVISVVSAAISVASIAMMAYNGYIQGLKDSVSETSQKVETLQDDIDDLDTSIDKYDEIIKTTGSAAEQKEKLISLQDELKTKYGEEAEAIDLVNGKYETQIALLKNMQKEKLEDQLGELQQGETDRDKLLSQNVKNMIASTVFDDEDSKNDSKALEALLEGKDTSQYKNLDVYKKVIELANKNNMQLNEFAGDIELTGTRENLFKFKEALEDYSDTLNSEQKKIISRMIQNKPYFYHGSIKTDTEDEYQTAY